MIGRPPEPHTVLNPTLQFLLESQALQEGVLGADDYLYADLRPVPSGYGTISNAGDILPYVALYPA